MGSLHNTSNIAGTTNVRRTLSIFGLAAFIAALVAVPARGQLTSNEAAQDDWGALIADAGDWTSVLSGKTVPNGLIGIEFENLTKAEWKQMRNEQIAAVRSNDDAVWQDAAVKIIFLSIYQSDKVDFDAASNPLMERYVFDRDENDRVLALAAMHAIGHRDTMARLSQRVRTEGSLRVRRLTVAAVQDYFDSDRAQAEIVRGAEVPAIAREK